MHAVEEERKSAKECNNGENVHLWLQLLCVRKTLAFQIFSFFLLNLYIQAYSNIGDGGNSMLFLIKNVERENYLALTRGEHRGILYLYFRRVLGKRI